MPKKPSYLFTIRITEGMSVEAETQAIDRLWGAMKNGAPFNRKDKVQVLIHLTYICNTLLDIATEYLEEEDGLNEDYIQHFDPA